MNKDLTFIILAFNEQKKVKLSIENYYNQLTRAKINFEIIVVNDGSTDHTIDEINKLKNKVIVQDNKKNLGFAKSIKTAIKKSNGDYFLWIGADNPNRDFRDIFEAFKSYISIERKNFLIIQHYDYENLKKRSPLRRFFSNNYTSLVNLLFNKNIPYFNGQSIFSKTNLNVDELCNSRFILAQILLENLKNKPEISYIKYELNLGDKDKSSENLLKMVILCLLDIFKYRLKYKSS